MGDLPKEPWQAARFGRILPSIIKEEECMKNFRKLLSAVLALAMVFSLAACGSSGDNPSEKPSENSGANSSAPAASQPSGSGDEEVTLTWAVWDKDTTTQWSALADAYTKDHPNVKFDMIDLGSTEYMTQLATQLSGGNGELDILSIKDIPGYSNLINLEMLEPLNDTITADPSMFNGLIEQLTAADGNYYAVPFISSFWMLFYNKDLFDAAGVDYPANDLSMEDFDALARQMTSGSGSDKVYGVHYHTWRSDVTLYSVLDGKNTIIDGSYDFLKPTYEMVLAQQNDGICMDYGELKTSGLHYSAAFENGQAAMVPMGSWFVSTLINYNNEAASNGVDPVNWGVVKYPHPAGVTAGSTLGQVTSLGINPNSDNKEAAADFLNWVATEDAAKALAATGNFPAISTSETSELLATADGFPTDEASKDALTVAALYLEMPMSDKASDIEQVLNTEHDAIMTGAETVDEGIANMNEQVQAILGG